ncbi:unknown [Prevotella sp. CAG:1058]|nr:unknown [Prevotella sp. CAG:1058]
MNKKTNLHAIFQIIFYTFALIWKQNTILYIIIIL